MSQCSSTTSLMWIVFNSVQLSNDITIFTSLLHFSSAFLFIPNAFNSIILCSFSLSLPQSLSLPSPNPSPPSLPILPLPHSLPITSPHSLPITSPHSLPITSPHSLPITSPHSLPITSPHSLPITSPHSLPITSPHSLPITSPHSLPHSLPITPLTDSQSLPLLPSLSHKNSLFYALIASLLIVPLLQYNGGMQCYGKGGGG